MYIPTSYHPEIEPHINPDIALLIAMENHNIDMSQLVVAEDILKDIDDLSALHMTFSVHGITKPLLQFSNHNGMLTAAIPIIPSLESMRGDLDVAASQPALEGIADAIREAGKRFLVALKNHLIKYKDWYKSFVTSIQKFVGGIGLFFTAVAMITAGPAVALVYFATTVIALATGSVLKRMLDHAKSAPVAIKQALSIKLPSVEEDYKDYHARIAEIFKSSAGFDVTKMNFDTESDANKSNGKDVKSLGYTVQSIKAVAVATGEAMKALETLGSSVEDKLARLANSPEAGTPTGRKALTWLTKIITVVMRRSAAIVTEGASTATKLKSAGIKSLNKAKTEENDGEKEPTKDTKK